MRSGTASTEPGVNEPKRPNRAKVLGILFIAGLLLAALFLSLELFARLKFGRTAARNRLTREFADSHARLMEASADSLWKPSWKAYKENSERSLVVNGRRHHVKINSHGFRSKEFRVPKPEGIFRIICIGASTTVEGETNETTYPAVLEAKLRLRPGGSKFEVINCGVSGYKSVDRFLLMPRVLSFEPDLVIDYGGVNDLSGAFLSAWKDSLSLPEQFLRRSYLLRDLSRPLLGPGPEDVAMMFNEVTRPHLEGCARLASQHHVKFACCSLAFPDSGQMNSEQSEFFDHNLRTHWGGEYLNLGAYSALVEVYNRQLREVCGRASAIYIPVAEGLDRRPALFKDICHMTPEGIAGKADVIYQFLVREPDGLLRR